MIAHDPFAGGRTTFTAPDPIPEPKVGQRWVSPKARIERRSVVDVGPHPYGKSGEYVSYYCEGSGNSWAASLDTFLR